MYIFRDRKMKELTSEKACWLLAEGGMIQEVGF